MSRHYRGDPSEPTASSKWLRDRWPYGSVLVLDTDHYVCDPLGERGLEMEWKHSNALGRNWRLTQVRAMRLGWWSCLFVYETDDGSPWGNVTAITATFADPEGRHYKPTRLDPDRFDAWVLSTFGRRAA